VRWAINKTVKWKRWFAWRPVIVDAWPWDNIRTRVWFEWIERRKPDEKQIMSLYRSIGSTFDPRQ
jgi:hypothetical protein